MLYLLISLGATVIGAVSGVGGGVIIKPILDLLSPYDAGTINLLSSFSVLAMAITSIGRHLYYRTPFDKNAAIPLALGGALGGLAGDFLFDKIALLFRYRENLTALQNLFLLLFLALVLIYVNFLRQRYAFQLQNTAATLCIGTVLGMVSTFLGIGGGPINMAALALLFSMGTKSAAVNSLLLILFSQLSKIIKITFTSGLAHYDLSMLIYMIPAGIAGGLIGSKLNKKLDGKEILRIFNTVLIFIMAVNAINIIF